MADIATAIISGTFAIAGSLGSVWLKDYLERRRQAHPTTASTGPGGPPAPPASAMPPRSAVALPRPLGVALGGFALGAAAAALRNVSHAVTDLGELAATAILALVVIVSIVHHARSRIDRSVALFELEALSLWAAFTFGWTLVHGSLWSDLVAFSVIGWLASALGGAVLVPLARFLVRRSAP